jgi:hypothetical protein
VRPRFTARPSGAYGAMELSLWNFNLDQKRGLRLGVLRGHAATNLYIGGREQQHEHGNCKCRGKTGDSIFAEVDVFAYPLAELIAPPTLRHHVETFATIIADLMLAVLRPSHHALASTADYPRWAETHWWQDFKASVVIMTPSHAFGASGRQRCSYPRSSCHRSRRAAW